MSDPRKPEPLGDFESRLRDARAREAAAKARQTAEPAGSKAAMGYAFRVGIELVVGLVVGAGIGWLLDYWLGTSPALLILFFFLGAAAGIRNVFRTAQEINDAAQRRD